MKTKIKLLAFIGSLLAAGLVLYGCGGNCDGDCVIRANIWGERTEYNNCGSARCDVGSHNVNYPNKNDQPVLANITCNCK